MLRVRGWGKGVRGFFSRFLSLEEKKKGAKEKKVSIVLRREEIPGSTNRAISRNLLPVLLRRRELIFLACSLRQALDVGVFSTCRKEKTTARNKEKKRSGERKKEKKKQ